MLHQCYMYFSGVLSPSQDSATYFEVALSRTMEETRVPRTNHQPLESISRQTFMILGEWDSNLVKWETKMSEKTIHWLLKIKLTFFWIFVPRWWLMLICMLMLYTNFFPPTSTFKMEWYYWFKLGGDTLI